MPGVSVVDFFAIVRPGQMDKLQFGQLRGEQRQRPGHQMVDGARSLAAPHDQQHGTLRVESERDAAGGGVHRTELGTHRRAGHFHGLAAQTARRGREPNEGRVHKRREPAIGPARNGI